MKALTVRQPWARFIAQTDETDQPKRVENRTWAPPASMLGAELLIHVSCSTPTKLIQEAHCWIQRAFGEPADFGRWDGDLLNEWELRCLRLVAGRIVCRVRLVGLVHAGELVWSMQGRDAYVREQAASPWYVGPYGWVLELVEAYECCPVVRGRLGLWDVPADVVAQLVPKAPSTAPIPE